MNNKQTLQVKIDLRMVCLLLLLVVAAMLIAWKPWQAQHTSRKITSNGQVTLKAVPDEYVLNPYFELPASDRAKANQDVAKLQGDINAQLKKLGVAEEQVSSSTNAYDKYDYAQPASAGTNTIQLSYIIKLAKKEVAQSVQDYLITLNPKGQLSPQASFSQQKSKELESEARQKAIDDARAKAQKTADQLGAKLGKVVSVSDGGSSSIGCSGSTVCPMIAADKAIESGSTMSAPAMGIAVQPGQNDYAFSVQVEFEIK